MLETHLWNSTNKLQPVEGGRLSHQSSFHQLLTSQVLQDYSHQQKYCTYILYHGKRAVPGGQPVVVLTAPVLWRCSRRPVSQVATQDPHHSGRQAKHKKLFSEWENLGVPGCKALKSSSNSQIRTCPLPGCHMYRWHGIFHASLIDLIDAWVVPRSAMLTQKESEFMIIRLHFLKRVRG